MPLASHTAAHRWARLHTRPGTRTCRGQEQTSGRGGGPDTPRRLAMEGPWYPHSRYGCRGMAYDGAVTSRAGIICQAACLVGALSPSRVPSSCVRLGTHPAPPLPRTHTQSSLYGSVSEWHGSDRPFGVTAPQTRSVLAGKRCSRMSDGAMPTECGPCRSCPIPVAPRCGGGAWGCPPRMGLASR